MTRETCMLQLQYKDYYCYASSTVQRSDPTTEHHAATVPSPPAFPSSSPAAAQRPRRRAATLHGERKGKACLTSDRPR